MQPMKGKTRDRRDRRVRPRCRVARAPHHELVGDGTIVSKAVEAAFRLVPRHRFAPGATLDEAYARDSIRTKRDEHGVTISAVSDPGIQAMMLEQASSSATRSWRSALAPDTTRPSWLTSPVRAGKSPPSISNPMSPPAPDTP